MSPKVPLRLSPFFNFFSVFLLTPILFFWILLVFVGNICF
uniref:Uncharacterized protein n=1 Tax=Rhizophora mucronata TaxID=61149 RepID=A0A2P2QT58_RHIMU